MVEVIGGAGHMRAQMTASLDQYTYPDPARTQPRNSSAAFAANFTVDQRIDHGESRQGPIDERAASIAAVVSEGDEWMMPPPPFGT